MELRYPLQVDAVASLFCSRWAGITGQRIGGTAFQEPRPASMVPGSTCIGIGHRELRRRDVRRTGGRAGPAEANGRLLVPNGSRSTWSSCCYGGHQPGGSRNVDPGRLSLKSSLRPSLSTEQSSATLSSSQNLSLFRRPSVLSRGRRCRRRFRNLQDSVSSFRPAKSPSQQLLTLASAWTSQSVLSHLRSIPLD